MKKIHQPPTDNPCTNGQQIPERSPAGRRLISCYQLQIKTRPRELLFPRNKKKNFQPSNLPFHSQPFSSPFPPLLSLSSPAITAKAAVLKSRLLFVEGDKRGRERFRVNVGEGWKAAGNSARTAQGGLETSYGVVDSVPDVQDVISKETRKRSRRVKGGGDYARSLRAILLALTRCSAKGKDNGAGITMLS